MWLRLNSAILDTQSLRSMKNIILESLQKGFALTNRSWGIFLVGLFFSLFFYPASFLEHSTITRILTAIGLLLLPISIGFYMSIPIFLVDKQQGKSLRLINILVLTLQSTKRLIIPGILLLLLFIALGILVYVFIVVVLYSGNFNIFSEEVPDSFNKWNIWILLFTGIFAFFSFTPIYFSLEKNGLFNSITKSLEFSLKHLKFIAVLALISWAFYSVNTLLPPISKQFQLLIQTLLGTYEVILLTAIPLVFYQSVAGTKVQSYSKKSILLFLLIIISVLGFAFLSLPKKSMTLSSVEEMLAEKIGFDKQVLTIVKKETGNELKQLKGYNIETDEEIEVNGILSEVSQEDALLVVYVLRPTLSPMGYLAFLSERNFGIAGQNDELAILKTTDEYEILRVKHTNGYNYDIDSQEIIAKLKEWDNRYQLEIIGADFDWFEAEFSTTPDNMIAFAKEVYDFCPDVVEQGTETVEKLAEEMKREQTIYCWWD